MIVGYLHLGDSTHGVTRYGVLLGEEARRRRDLQVVEVATMLGTDPREDRRRLFETGRRLRSCDLVHVQFNCQSKRSIWGAGWPQLSNFTAFLRACGRPVVATLHDVPESAGVKPLLDLAAQSLPSPMAWRSNGPASPGSRGPRRRLRRSDLFRTVVLHHLLRRLGAGFVCSHEELRRLRGIPGHRKVAVVPHFVEPRAIEATPAGSKARLGLVGKRLVTLLGYLHPRKGWPILVDSLALLPRDVYLLFAGADSTSTDMASAIQRRAEASGVADRLRVTGYLGEPELEDVLAATDLAVCPFETVSASGSLSTWISVPRRVVGSDLPLFAEYNALVPGSIATFAPYTPAALAARIVSCLTEDPAPQMRRLQELRGRLALSSVFAAHLDRYRRLVGPAAPITRVGGGREAPASLGPPC